MSVYVTHRRLGVNLSEEFPCIGKDGNREIRDHICHEYVLVRNTEPFGVLRELDSKACYNVFGGGWSEAHGGSNIEFVIVGEVGQYSGRSILVAG